MRLSKPKPSGWKMLCNDKKKYSIPTNEERITKSENVAKAKIKAKNAEATHP